MLAVAALTGLVLACTHPPEERFAPTVVLVDADVDTNKPPLRRFAWLTPVNLVEAEHDRHDHGSSSDHTHHDHGTEIAMAFASTFGSSTTPERISIQRLVVSTDEFVSTESMIEALEAAASIDGPVIVNLSVGALGPIPDHVASLLRELTETAVVVVAAGNEARFITGETRTLCETTDRVICVAALEPDSNTIAPSSSRGPAVDVAVAGNSSLSDVSLPSTSTAAARTTGILAQLWMQHPGDTPSDLAERLCELADVSDEALTRCGIISTW